MQHDSTTLVGERWPGDGPGMVLLHAAIADKRSWYSLSALLAPHASVVSYDRPGFGETAPPTGEFSDVADLLAVLDAVGFDRAWLVGSSMGGLVALEAALAHPDRVAGLILFAPAVSGITDFDESKLDPQEVELENRVAELESEGRFDEANELEIWLWLDGPHAAQGRVTGAPRYLVRTMNRPLLERSGLSAGRSGPGVWPHLSEITAPTLVITGDLDSSLALEWGAHLASTMPHARHVVVEQMAHLPYLERADVVAPLMVDALHADRF